ncbi:MAG: glycosyltransferase family 4 protein [Deltaproteobacteria bacterium]|nr:glycosyltransferase family 4 protein [Deltaproteobacteria bacterium]
MTAEKPVAYFVGRWPSPSEAFIREEIRSLLSLGHPVYICALRDAGPEGDQAARDYFKTRCRILWPPRWRTFFWAAVSWFLRKPVLLASLFWSVLWKSNATLRERMRGIVLAGLGSYAAHELEKEIEPSRLHAHFAYGNALVARVAASLLGTRYSLTMHHSDILFPEGLMECKLENADPLVTTSQFNRRAILKSWAYVDPSKLKVIYSGVDTEKFVPPAVRKNAHGPVRLLTVARMHHNKDPLTVIAAAAELKKNGLDFTWRWIGDGRVMEQCKEAVKKDRLEDNIQFLGWLSHSQIPQHYRWADIFVLGSLSEGLPFVLMEAMASGLAVISTAVTGVPELITSGKDGLLVTAGAPHALADAVAGLIAHPEERRILGLAARERVVKDFNLVTNAERLWKTFSG